MVSQQDLSCDWLVVISSHLYGYVVAEIRMYVTEVAGFWKVYAWFRGVSSIEAEIGTDRCNICMTSIEFADLIGRQI